MKKLLTLILVVAMVFAFVGCASQQAPEDPVDEPPVDNELPLAGQHFVVAVNAENAPMESVDSGGKYVGFSVDLADALSEKLGFTYEWSDMEFFGLISAIQENRADMIISSISATDERRKMVDFTDGYFTPVTCIIASEGSGIEKIEDLDGKKVGGATGTMFEKYAKSIPGVKYISYDSTVPAIEIIGTSELDAIIESSTYGERYGKNKDLTVSVIPKSVIKDFLPSYAIALPKDSANLEPLNKALAELKEEGFLNTLYEKYLGEDYVAKLKIYEEN